MRDLIAASASTKRLREKMQAIGRAVIEDGETKPLIEEAEAEFCRLALAMGFSVVLDRQIGGRS